MDALQHPWTHLNPSEVPMVSSSVKRVFKLYCTGARQHYGYFTVGAVDYKQDTLHCYICTPMEAIHPSSHELEAYKAIEQAIKVENNIPNSPYQWFVDAISLWVREAKVVPSKPKSPVDIYFIKPDLICQIDGSQHFADDMHDVSVIEQQRRDREFDDAAWGDNCRVLRVHYKDMSDFEHYLLHAVELCLQQPTGRFIRYSHSWPIGNRHPS